MDLVQTLLTIVNSIFAIFGVLVAVETIKIRTKENKSEGTIEHISSENTDSFDNFKNPFGEKFYKNTFGENILRCIYKNRNNKNFESSEHIEKYRDHYWLKGSRFIINPYSAFHIKYMFFWMAPVFISMALVLLSINSTFLLSISILFTFFLLATPFGIYRDKESTSGTAIYGFFSLGKVKYVSAYFREYEDNSVDLHLFVRVRVVFYNISIYKRTTYDNIDSACKEYILVKNFCSPLAKGYDITYTTPTKTESSLYTYIIEIYYGWIRLIWFISEKYKLLKAAIFRKS